MRPPYYDSRAAATRDPRPATRLRSGRRDRHHAKIKQETTAAGGAASGVRPGATGARGADGAVSELHDEHEANRGRPLRHFDTQRRIPVVPHYKKARFMLQFSFLGGPGNECQRVRLLVCFWFGTTRELAKCTRRKFLALSRHEQLALVGG